jgi:hypothetical protein
MDAQLFLPSARHAGELLNFDPWLSDMDFGEFFHNFHMDERVRKHSGVDVACLNLHAPSWRTYDPKSQLRWVRLFMGSKPSPYNAVRHYYWAEKFANGNPAEPSTLMGFDSVILNLPGMSVGDKRPGSHDDTVREYNTGTGAIAVTISKSTYADAMKRVLPNSAGCRNKVHSRAHSLERIQSN